MTFKKARNAAALAAGWRSGLEERIAKELTDHPDCRWTYEALRIPFTPPLKLRHYTPDFVLINNGIIIETKGRFVTADRQKLLFIQAEHPDLDIRLIFSNSKSRISKQSKTTYGDWCRH